MSRAACLMWLSLAALTAAVVTPARSQGQLKPPLPERPRETDAPVEAIKAEAGEARFVGSQSCAAAACHGSPLAVDDDPATPWREAMRNEHLVWFDRDPHSKSSATLTTQTSRRMIGALARSLDLSSHEAAATCTACHDPLAGRMARTSIASQARVRQGVGCESCHGPAGDTAASAPVGARNGWLHEHYNEVWRKLEPREKAIRGMNDTANLAARAQLCADCHIGSPGREVNHDLIAAGHPPLKFELTSYLDYLKDLGAVHWNDAAERSTMPDLELRTWIIGRLIGQAAALEQTARRANAAKDEFRSTPWPEFSEFDCTSCHHSLAHESWRRGRASSGALGRPAWQSWHFGEQASERTRAWRPELESFARPDELKLKVIAEEAAELRRLAESVEARASRSDPSALLDNPIATPLGLFDGKTISPGIAIESWDDACQAYLGLAAVEQAHCDRVGTPSAPAAEATKQIDELLRDLRALLAQPTKHEKLATRQAITRSLEELLAAMRAGGRFD